jgi:hypothetical protein
LKDRPRVGITTTTLAASVKEGSLSTTRVRESDGVEQLTLSGDRIGIITDSVMQISLS